MDKRIGVLIIHGVGSQAPEFSADIIRELSARLGDQAPRFAWQEVFWAKVLKSREDALWAAMRQARDHDGEPLDLDWVWAREFIIHNVGDALAYHRDFCTGEAAYGIVHRIISSSLATLYKELDDPTAPTVVLAHSLGGHMISNYIWDRQTGPAAEQESSALLLIPNLVAMITFGCNIPLFSIAYEEARTIRLPGDGITKPELVEASQWLNFYDRDDVLGWPLRSFYEKDLENMTQDRRAAQKATTGRIKDYEINVGRITRSWNMAAHANYWTDGDLTDPVAEYLKQLITALDA